jgi:hypothetical protein
MPRPEQFTGPGAYYATAFHEIAHAIAETASGLCRAATGITPEPRPGSRAISHLRNDTRAIFTAFGKARAAADFILESPQPARKAISPHAERQAGCPAASRLMPPRRREAVTPQDIADIRDALNLVHDIARDQREVGQVTLDKAGRTVDRTALFGRK